MEWWANIATVAAVILAAVGLMATALSVRSQARSNDLNSLFLVTTQIREAEARFRDSGGDPEANRDELVHYLNLLETLAAAVNGALFGRVTRRIACDRLVNDIAILIANERSRSCIQTAITSEETFQELARFEKKHRAAIRSLARIKQEEFRVLAVPDEEKRPEQSSDLLPA